MQDRLSDWLSRAVGGGPNQPANPPAAAPASPAKKPFSGQQPAAKPGPKPAPFKPKPNPAQQVPSHKPGRNQQPSPARRPANYSPGTPGQSGKIALRTRGKPHPHLDCGDDIVRVVNLSGLEQVGRNMSAIFYKGDIITIDCGLEFADIHAPGVDYFIPDTTILEERKERIRGMLITHGHLDHIGALQHILPKLDFPPVYATPLTMGLIRERLDEARILKSAKLIEVNPDLENKIKLGNFEADFFRVNHSIPDSTGISIRTPSGTIVHTGDFKFDLTPADGQLADWAKMANLGKAGIVLSLNESTNSEKPGNTMSERVIAENLMRSIESCDGRIIVATFGSLVGRVQHVLHAAAKTDRTVFVTGRSMIKNIDLAEKLGYLKIPRGMLKPLKDARAVEQLPPEKVIVLSTGSQGEELAALNRMANGDHAQVKIRPGDTVIFSSAPIPGNEDSVIRVVENLMRLGAKVITNKHLDLHVSGHGNREDLKLMLSLLRPQNLCPIHGMLHMRHAHRELAKQIGMAEENVFLVDNGEILEVLPNRTVRVAKHKVLIRNIAVDGLGVGDVGAQTLRERTIMGQNGALFIVLKVDKKSRKLIGEPMLISRGFVDLQQSENLSREVMKVTAQAYEVAAERGKQDLKNVRYEVVHAVEHFVLKRLEREPLIVAFIVEN